MKKFLKFLLCLLAIIMVLLVIVYLTAGIWLKSAVSTLVPQMTKTQASLQEADISLLRGKIALKGLKVGNPEGFTHQNAFELGEISVKFEPTTLLSSKIIINEIKINGTKINAELAAKTGNINLMILNDNVQEYLGNPVSTKPKVAQNAVAQPKTKNDKAVVVRDLKITNSSLTFVLLNKKLQVNLPDIQQKNIGEKQKETLDQVIGDIFGKLTTSSFDKISKTSQESVNKLLDGLAGRSKEASGFVKGLKAEMANMF